MIELLDSPSQISDRAHVSPSQISDRADVSPSQILPEKIDENIPVTRGEVQAMGEGVMREGVGVGEGEMDEWQVKVLDMWNDQNKDPRRTINRPEGRQRTSAGTMGEQRTPTAEDRTSAGNMGEHRTGNREDVMGVEVEVGAFGWLMVMVWLIVGAVVVVVMLGMIGGGANKEQRVSSDGSTTNTTTTTVPQDYNFSTVVAQHDDTNLLVHLRSNPMALSDENTSPVIDDVCVKSSALDLTGSVKSPVKLTVNSPVKSPVNERDEIDALLLCIESYLVTEEPSPVKSSALDLTEPVKSPVKSPENEEEKEEADDDCTAVEEEEEESLLMDRHGAAPHTPFPIVQNGSHHFAQDDSYPSHEPNDGGNGGNGGVIVVVKHGPSATAQVRIQHSTFPTNTLFNASTKS